MPSPLRCYIDIAKALRQSSGGGPMDKCEVDYGNEVEAKGSWCGEQCPYNANAEDGWMYQCIPELINIAMAQWMYQWKDYMHTQTLHRTDGYLALSSTILRRPLHFFVPIT